MKNIAPLKNLVTNLRRAGFFIAIFILAAATSLPAVAASQENTRQAAFKAAAQEFGVPEEVLMAVSYNQSRWESHHGQPSASGGYGLMHLVSNEFSEKTGRGDDVPARAKSTPASHMLDEAATLAGTTKEALMHNDAENLRGGAALLAHYAKAQNGGTVPTNARDWYAAIAEYGGSADADQASDFADSVFWTMQNGAARKTSDNQLLQIAEDKNIQPDKTKFNELEHTGRFHRQTKSQSGVECPWGLDCRFVPARYAQNNPNEPSDYGNYDTANRPTDTKINSIVIHDTEGSYTSAIERFQDPASYTSAHYVIRSSDGQITQMVKTKDVAWHAGNWYTNMHSIGVEHEGFVTEGATWYTEQMYRASAKLVRYLAEKYNIPLDRQHIIGHDQFQGPTANDVAGMHTDPGPFWDWEHYMELLHAPVGQTGSENSKIVTIAPTFHHNLPPYTDCASGTCVALPSQPSSEVYMRTAPSDTAPLVTDAGLHTNGAPGTTSVSDTAARASYGEQFVLAERRGNWSAVWFNGQKAWFKNSQNWWQPTAVPANGKIITPKSGRATIPLYGRAYPETSAYPTTIPAQVITPLPYTIAAGQKYVSYGQAPTDYLYAWTFDSSVPNDHTVVSGHEKYYLVSYNHRQGYVKASDVNVSYEW